MDLQSWLQSINIFRFVDFSVLYSWLPSSIAGAITVVLGFLFVLAVIGLIRRFLLR